jgi:hypothetical protein
MKEGRIANPSYHNTHRRAYAAPLVIRLLTFAR